MKTLAPPEGRPAAGDAAALSAYYDNQYNNRLRVPHAPELLAQWSKASARVRDRSTRLRELGYGPLPSERLDLFSASKPGQPLVFFIHGGYWRSLDKDDFSFLAPAFASADINLAVVNYSLAPSVSVRVIVQQMVAALVWLYKHGRSLGFDRDQIHVVGHSAGGHLAAMMLAVLWRRIGNELPRQLVKSALAISGLYDMRPMACCPYLNGDLRLDEKEAIALSPALMRPATKAPLLLAVGEQESPEFQWQTATIKAAWAPRTLVGQVDQPGLNHFNICDGLADPASALFQALLEQIG